MEDYFDYHTNTALELIGERTGLEAAQAHALLAIAYAIRATTHESAGVVDTPRAVVGHISTGFPHFNQAK